MRNIDESNPAIIYEKEERHHPTFGGIKNTGTKKKGIILADFKYNNVVI